MKLSERSRYGMDATLESVAKIKGAGIIPVSIVINYLIKYAGEIIVKRRITHGASFIPPSHQPVDK